jgi:hypothetical protein
MTQQTLNGALTSNFFEVTQEINLKMGDSTQNATTTYAVFAKRITGKKYDLEITRSGFKVNDKEPINKITVVALAYFECIFPLQFSIQENKLVLANASDIAQRILKKDAFFLKTTVGKGFTEIREPFIEKTNTEKKLQEFIATLGLVRVLELALQRYAETDIGTVSWTIPLLGASFWSIKKLEYPQENSVTYIESAIDQEQLKDAMLRYLQEQQLKETPEIKESEIFATFKHEIKYLKDLLTIARSQTNISLQVGTYFEYQEALTLASTID